MQITSVYLISPGMISSSERGNACLRSIAEFAAGRGGVVVPPGCALGAQRCDDRGKCRVLRASHLGVLFAAAPDEEATLATLDVINDLLADYQAYDAITVSSQASQLRDDGLAAQLEKHVNGSGVGTLQIVTGAEGFRRLFGDELKQGDLLLGRVGNEHLPLMVINDCALVALVHPNPNCQRQRMLAWVLSVVALYAGMSGGALAARRLEAPNVPKPSSLAGGSGAALGAAGAPPAAALAQALVPSQLAPTQGPSLPASRIISLISAKSQEVQLLGRQFDELLRLLDATHEETMEAVQAEQQALHELEEDAYDMLAAGVQASIRKEICMAQQSAKDEAAAKARAARDNATYDLSCLSLQLEQRKRRCRNQPGTIKGEIESAYNAGDYTTALDLCAELEDVDGMQVWVKTAKDGCAAQIAIQQQQAGVAVPWQ